MAVAKDIPAKDIPSQGAVLVKAAPKVVKPKAPVAPK